MDEVALFLSSFNALWLYVFCSLKKYIYTMQDFWTGAI